MNRAFARGMALSAGAAALLAAFTAPAAAASVATIENCFTSLIGRARAAEDRAPLRSDAALTAQAREHSADMASEKSLFHSTDLFGELSGWTMLGENVGRGSTCKALHTAFMGSPPHRANILNSRFRYVGVGVRIAAGMIYVTELFGKRESASDGSASKAAVAPAAPPAKPSSAKPKPSSIPVVAPRRAETSSHDARLRRADGQDVSVSIPRQRSEGSTPDEQDLLPGRLGAFAVPLMAVLIAGTPARFIHVRRKRRPSQAGDDTPSPPDEPELPAGPSADEAPSDVAADGSGYMQGRPANRAFTVHADGGSEWTSRVGRLTSESLFSKVNDLADSVESRLERISRSNDDLAGQIASVSEAQWRTETQREVADRRIDGLREELDAVRGMIAAMTAMVEGLSSGRPTPARDTRTLPRARASRVAAPTRAGAPSARGRTRKKSPASK